MRDEQNVGPQMSCAWCGDRSIQTEVDSGLFRCLACGAATTHPWPTDLELEQAYGNWYRPSSGRFHAGADRVLAFSRTRLARRLNRIAPPGPVLDVGAGDGSLIRAIRGCGREALGLERARGGDGVIAREIVDFDEHPAGWAAVIFWHSLEHLRDPALALARAAELLARGGILVVAVPNLSSWQARAFGPGWFHLDLPRHLVHLPAKALRAEIMERGLTIERVSYWRGGQLVFGWLHGMVAALPGHPDLYDAIRRPEARKSPLSRGARVMALVAGVGFSPLAGLLTVAEVAARAGGTVYVEARRP